MNKYLRRLGIGIALASMLNTGCAYTVKYKGIDKSVEKSTKRGNTVNLYLNAGVAKEMRFGLKHPEKADANLDGLVRGAELKGYIFNFFKKKDNGVPAGKEYSVDYVPVYRTVINGVVTETPITIDPSQPNQ